MEAIFFDHEIETLPPERLRALQETKLGALVSRTYRRSPIVTQKLNDSGAAPNDVRTLAESSYERGQHSRHQGSAGDGLGGEVL